MQGARYLGRRLAHLNVNRKPAAILAADVVSYSRLVGADEEGTIAGLRSLREELVDPSIAKQRWTRRQDHWRRTSGRFRQCRGCGVKCRRAAAGDGEPQKGVCLRINGSHFALASTAAMLGLGGISSANL